MALIECKECGKEISDQATACPHCGCPVANASKIGGVSQKKTIKKVDRKLLLGGVLIALVVIVGSTMYYSLKVKPKNTYNEAIAFLEKGKYEEAEAIFGKIPKYEGVEVILDEMKYETLAYTCITDLKKRLKNPDSFQPYEIKFYNLSEADGKDLSKFSTSKPVCIMHYGAQNGFGGNTTGYVLFLYSDEDEEYSTLGTCDSLDEDEIDEDDALDLLICKMINLCKEQGKEVGQVDMTRIKDILKNDAYSTIKIIE